MADDELAEINGIKPKVLLADNEEKEFRSTSSKSVYKIKRTFDHYYCSCPAWRNQAGVPVNARTCKHLLEMLGLEYETARLELKNPDGPPPKAAKGSSKKTSTAKKPTSTSKAKPSSKRKKIDEDEDEEEEEEEATSTKKPASRASARKPSSKRKKDEEEEETKKPASRASTRKPPSKRKKADEDDEEEETKKPVSKASDKPSSKAKGKAPAKKLKLEEDIEEKDEEEEQEKREEADADAEEAKPQAAASSSSSGDELAEINGIKPKVLMKDGDETEVKSQTSNSSYKVKRTWDHYYCTCPAWRNQGGHPVNARTCKHLRSLLGDAYEDARLKFKNPYGPVPTTKSKPGSKGKGKRKKADDDDDDDDGDGKPASKRAKGDDDDASKKPELLLANKWDIEKGADPTGWWVSEKLDGVRTFYDGKKMYSRLGNLFTPPTWFLDKLPKDCTLDGELFSGRGDFQSTVSIVKTMHSPHWGRVEFHVFDIPSMGSKPFEERYAHLQKLFGEKGTHASDKVKVVEHEQAKSRQHVLDKLKEVETLGGEGLMLRKAGSLYEGHRSGTLLKIKTFYDAEAIVVGHDPGKGRNAGVTGALKCKMESGKLFNVGTGLSDKQRKNPPKIGSIIVYRFQELTKDGVPRFPSFIGEAADKTEPKDAEVPEHRKGGAKKGDDED